MTVHNGRAAASGTDFACSSAQLVLGEIAKVDSPLPFTDPREPVVLPVKKNRR